MAKDLIHTLIKPNRERPNDEKFIPIFGLGEKRNNAVTASKNVKIELVLSKLAIDRLNQWIAMKKSLYGNSVTRYDVTVNLVQKILRATEDNWNSVTIASNDLGEL